MNRSLLMQSLNKAGVIHPFVEDCPCGDCEDFFAFGRDKAGTIWIVFAEDGEPLKLRNAGDSSLSLRLVSAELRQLLNTIEHVLEISDPPFAPASPVDAAVQRKAEQRADVSNRAKARWLARRMAGYMPEDAKPVTFNDETLTVQEWATRLGLTKTALLWRLERWGVERALTTPPRKKRA